MSGGDGAFQIDVAVPAGLNAHVHIEAGDDEDSTTNTGSRKCVVIERSSGNVVWPHNPATCGAHSPSCLEAFLDTTHPDGARTVDIRVSAGTHAFSRHCE